MDIDDQASVYAQELSSSPEGQVAMALFLNRCQRSLILVKKAAIVFTDTSYGNKINEILKRTSKRLDGYTPTMIEANVFASRQMVKRFNNTGRYSKHNPEIQFIFDMLSYKINEEDISIYAKQVDYAMSRMFLCGKFNNNEIIETGIRCSPINDCIETLMLPLQLIHDNSLAKDRKTIIKLIQKGMSLSTAVSVCKESTGHRPYDDVYYEEVCAGLPDELMDIEA